MKWREIRNNLKVGDMVLVLEQNLSCFQDRVVQVKIKGITSRELHDYFHCLPNKILIEER